MSGDTITPEPHAEPLHTFVRFAQNIMLHYVSEIIRGETMTELSE